MTIILVACSDEHVNDYGGLCSVRQFDAEKKPLPITRTREAMLRVWNELPDKVEQIAEREKADKIIWENNGDAADLNRRGRMTLINHTESEVLDHLGVIFRKLTNLSTERYVIRGTEFHNGEECHIEAKFGENIGAVPDPETGDHAWWHLKLEVEGVLFDFGHHPKFRSASEWGLVGATEKESAHVALMCVRNDERVPDVVVRGHLHRWALFERAKPYVYYLDGWQAMTAFGYNKGFTVSSAVGALVFVCRDGMFTKERVWWRPRKERVWKASST